jgi:maltose/maltodextrin transport system permease protein
MMVMVQGKSLKYRVWATHIGLWFFLSLIIFPMLMIVAISLREGNFASGSIIPEHPSWEHWKLALGFAVTHADGSVTPPPFPVLTWLWNSARLRRSPRC